MKALAALFPTVGWMGDTVFAFLKHGAIIYLSRSLPDLEMTNQYG
jgi:hypothetical protein